MLFSKRRLEVLHCHIDHDLGPRHVTRKFDVGKKCPREVMKLYVAFSLNLVPNRDSSLQESSSLRWISSLMPAVGLPAGSM